ncbi:MAG: hypothetical protein KGV48_001275 [Alcaligenaceae bacterium]|nr:hypothetical protein [Alcaligenaceae bacterium]
MVKSLRVVLLSLAVFVLSGCQLLDAFAKMTDNVTGPTAFVPEEVSQSVDKAVEGAYVPKNTRALYNDAKPVMKKVLGLLACGKHKQANAYAEDPEFYSRDAIEGSALHNGGGLKGHPEDACFNLFRVKNVKLDNFRTFKFKVIYVSPYTKEARGRHFKFIRDMNNEWTFKASVY